MDSVYGFGGGGEDGNAFFVYTLLFQRAGRIPSAEVTISSGGDVVRFQPLFTSPALRHKHFPAGGFREGEIDRKQFLTFTLLSQTGEVAIDSYGDDLSLQPFFLCPSLRLKVSNLGPKLVDDLRLCNTSPFFPLDDQQVRYLLHSDTHDGDNVCKLPVAPLFWCNNKYSHYETFTCDACRSSDLGTDYYLCLTCDKKFHKECVESPLEITHPSLPFLSFKLYTNSYGFGYGCLTNQVFMDPVLAMQPIPIVIDHTKRHPHPLTFFPKQASLPCDVCGLIKQLMPTYVCLRCFYAVHQECIYFPNVIKISRHHHRIYLTSSLPSGNLSCGVCRRKVDNHYGAYSCNKSCGDYFVHTRCALRKDLWDGEDLEGVPEEPEIIV